MMTSRRGVEKYIGCVCVCSTCPSPLSTLWWGKKYSITYSLYFWLHLPCMWSWPNLELGSSISVWFSRLSHAKSWTHPSGQPQNMHTTPIHICPNHTHNTYIDGGFTNYINNSSLLLFLCLLSHRQSKHHVSCVKKVCVCVIIIILPLYLSSPPFLLICFIAAKIRLVDNWCWWSWLLHLFLFLFHMMRIFTHSNDDMPHLPPISAIDECLPNRTWQPPTSSSSAAPSQQSSPSTSSYSLNSNSNSSNSSSSTPHYPQHYATTTTTTIPLHPQATRAWTMSSRQNENHQVANHPDLPQVKEKSLLLLVWWESRTYA